MPVLVMRVHGPFRMVGGVFDSFHCGAFEGLVGVG
jgi:hypothetical protein